MKKRLLTLVTCIFIVLSLTACGGTFSNKSLQKLIQENKIFTQVDVSSVKVLSDAEISDSQKAILFSAKILNTPESAYYIAIADTKKDELKELEIEYQPMQYLHTEITKRRHSNLNMAYFEKISEKLSEDADFFDSIDNGIEFLRSITGKGGITSAATAQEAIAEIAKFELRLEKSEEFFGIFEDDSANPICYAAADKISVYVWDWLPESKYLSYVSSNDKEKLDEAIEEHGPAYEDEEVWICYDIDGNQTGTYKTKSELYKAVTGKEMDFGEDDNETDGILKFVTVTGNKPFAFESDGEVKGIDVDIASAIARELNMELEISTASESSAISGTKSGKFHMAMAGFTSDDADDDITFTDNYYDDCVIILCENNSRINSKISVALSDLKKDGTIKNITEKYNSEDKPEEDEKDESDAEEVEVQISYRVRKDAEDSSSQVGAYAHFENAKKEADARKAEGYKVYDMSGNLVYTPQ